MERFYYETPDFAGNRWRVFDRRRGSPDSYASRESRAMAVCDTRDDAEAIVAALNATVKNDA